MWGGDGENGGAHGGGFGSSVVPLVDEPRLKTDSNQTRIVGEVKSGVGIIGVRPLSSVI